MKISGAILLGLLAFGAGFVSSAQNARIQSIQQYNDLLPLWGTSWSAGAKSINGYYPSFYTGFAMRVQTPERIHIRVSRGNQTRVSVILDEKTITDYSFDLVKRYNVYRQMTGGPGAKLNTQPSGANFVTQMDYFNQVIESPQYDILAFVERANKGNETAESIYTKNLNLLRTLNPDRVFMLNIDLAKEFQSWKSRVIATSGGQSANILSQPQQVVIALNTLVFGRINFESKPSDLVLAKLKFAIDAALTNVSEEAFNSAALDLFKAVTGAKYNFQVLNNKGVWQSALQCPSVSFCRLSYPEFTAIYPTGSVMEKTSDEFGNTINSFATPGLWNFVIRGGGRGVDNIRDEPYYGFIPKMDYQDIGNGFHNPAVRFFDPSKALKATLGLNPSHNNYWAVKRGGVSHGCLRLPSGSVWELRYILPVEDEKMAQVSFFGHRPQDFDLFDIDGTGQLKVMGVEYFISYGLQGTDGAAKREGSNLEINQNKRIEFYTDLYGAKNVFALSGTNFNFINPRISLPSYLDLKKASVATRLQLSGQYPLYEQKYEKDKIQFYAIGEMSSQNKKIVRLMGRIRGCAPNSDKKICGEQAFDSEMKALVK